MEQRLIATYLRPGIVERAAAAGIGAVGIGAGILLAAWGISQLWRYSPPEVIVRQDTPGGNDAKTPTGDVIKREVTVFFHVKHSAGNVVTGWSYRDGGGRAPIRKYCYYTASNADHSSTKVDIAFNRVRTPQIHSSVVPDLEGALSKCQWGGNESG